MRICIYLMIFIFPFAASSSFALQTVNCNDNMVSSTPDDQFKDNGDETVTDLKTGLMWKVCLEGLSGADCLTGTTASIFTWETALQQPAGVTTGTHTDWRLPNIKELQSIVEEKCYSSAINLTVFPGTPNSIVWSNSPYAGDVTESWSLDFADGQLLPSTRSTDPAVNNVRLVRDVTQ